MSQKAQKIKTMNNQSSKYNFVFWGTDEFSLQVLETLKDNGLVPSLIITTTDKPQGRKKEIIPSPVKKWSIDNKINFIQPTDLKEKNIFPEKNWDFFLVASYGKIIPNWLLDIPKHGTLNIHPSLLPKYRGPSPIETTLLNGDETTGVSIIKLDEEMDHGPIIVQEKLTIEQNCDYNCLRDKLAILGAEIFAKNINQWITGEITPLAQKHEHATFTQKIKKDDGFLKPTDSAKTNYHKILALNPWPGTYINYSTPHGEIRLIIKKAHLENDQLIFDQVLPAGRKEMTWEQFQHGLNSQNSSHPKKA